MVANDIQLPVAACFPDEERPEEVDRAPDPVGRETRIDPLEDSDGRNDCSTGPILVPTTKGGDEFRWESAEEVA